MFADLRGMPKLQDAVMNRLREFATKDSWFQRTHPMSLVMFSIYDNTLPSSPLRRFFVEFILHQRLIEWLGRPHGTMLYRCSDLVPETDSYIQDSLMGWPAQFIYEVQKRRRELARARVGNVPVELRLPMVPHCAFHVHGYGQPEPQ